MSRPAKAPRVRVVLDEAEADRIAAECLLCLRDLARARGLGAGRAELLTRDLACASATTPGRALVVLRRLRAEGLVSSRVHISGWGGYWWSVTREGLAS